LEVSVPYLKVKHNKLYDEDYGEQKQATAVHSVTFRLMEYT